MYTLEDAQIFSEIKYKTGFIVKKKAVPLRAPSAKLKDILHDSDNYL